MVNKSKNIGTAAETALVRYLRPNGFSNAERRALAGAYDLGDVTGCPGLVWEMKGGTTAHAASDGQVTAWLAETETERVNAQADYGILVLSRAGIGPARAGRWWAIIPGDIFAYLAYGDCDISCCGFITDRPPLGPVRLWLSDVVHLLRLAGYGDPIPHALTDKATA